MNKAKANQNKGFIHYFLLACSAKAGLITGHSFLRRQMPSVHKSSTSSFFAPVITAERIMWNISLISLGQLFSYPLPARCACPFPSGSTYLKMVIPMLQDLLYLEQNKGDCHRRLPSEENWGLGMPTRLYSQGCLLSPWALCQGYHKDI